MNTKVNSSKVNQCILVYKGASQVALVVKSLPACAGDIRDVGSIPGSGRFPKRRSWQPIPVFLVGESCGQSSLTGFPGSSAGKESTCNEGDPRFNSWVENIPWRRGRLPTPVFWPEEFHGQSMGLQSRARLSNFHYTRL